MPAARPIRRKTRRLRHHATICERPALLSLRAQTMAMLNPMWRKHHRPSRCPLPLESPLLRRVRRKRESARCARRPPAPTRHALSGRNGAAADRRCRKEGSGDSEMGTPRPARWRVRQHLLPTLRRVRRRVGRGMSAPVRRRGPRTSNASSSALAAGGKRAANSRWRPPRRNRCRVVRHATLPGLPPRSSGRMMSMAACNLFRA